MICGKLHNKRRRVARKTLCFLKHNTRNDYCRNADKICRSSNKSRFTEERTRNQADNRKLCRTRNKGCCHNSHTAVAFIFNSTRSHNARNTASRSDKHRNKGFARKSEMAENSVHNKGNARHITASLKKCKHNEKH